VAFAVDTVLAFPKAAYSPVHAMAIASPMQEREKRHEIE
jgi:hypothetical protein